MSEWDDWIGREQNGRDTLTPQHAFQWCSTLDLEWPGDGIMPQGIHLALCTPVARTDCLGEDGHPVRDDSSHSFLPPLPLPRRMWAGSEFAFLAPIAMGAGIARTSRITGINEKSGKSGKLGFVSIEHVTTADGVEAVREVQTLVYREAVSPDAPLSPPEPGDSAFDPSGWDLHEAMVPDARLLFRYSALTFNTHRIHYDASYCREVERYRGLVVHGPLMASLLLQMAAQELGDNRLKGFAFRALSPAIADETLHLVMRKAGSGLELGTFASDGRQCLAATAQI